MDFAYIIPLLALVTMLGAIVFAIVSKKAVEDRRGEGGPPKSTLAADADDGKADPPDT